MLRQCLFTFFNFLGDFLFSPTFGEKREELASFLYEKSEETVKIRTLSTNYSYFLAVVWKCYDVFEDVWADMGYSWDGFLEWIQTTFVPFLVKQHIEKDHSKHSIRRYIIDLQNYILPWSLVDRRKILKICETKKLSNGQKYCLAFHASPR